MKAYKVRKRGLHTDLYVKANEHIFFTNNGTILHYTLHSNDYDIYIKKGEKERLMSESESQKRAAINTFSLDPLYKSGLKPMNTKIFELVEVDENTLEKID